MINDNTHLVKAVLEGNDTREIIRIEIEDAVNLLLKTELTEFFPTKSTIQEVITLVTLEMDTMSAQLAT